MMQRVKKVKINGKNDIAFSGFLLISDNYLINFIAHTAIFSALFCYKRSAFLSMMRL